MADIAFFERLETLIAERIATAPESSYTAKLAGAGVGAAAQKVGEEGVELALAAVSEDDARVVDESADLLYHTLVLLAIRGIPLARVVATLERRHAEKTAAR
jgi:phosphoribosyl-ATP pyrophosphohydrolase